MKLTSWNVNGFRSVLNKNFGAWLLSESPDILCLQETKVQESQLSPAAKNIPGYETLWCSGIRKGYSGVATFVKGGAPSPDLGFGLDPRLDCEGRILITRHHGFTLLNIYFPNGQKDDERLRYKLDFYDATLDFCERLRKKGEELVICGDFNTAHNEIDLARPKDNVNVSGFLRIERDWMDKFEAHGYVDTFRALHPQEVCYSWWSVRTAARERNVGWRLDYFYVTSGLMPRVKRAEILTGVTGSDHCPVLLDLI